VPPKCRLWLWVPALRSFRSLGRDDETITAP